LTKLLASDLCHVFAFKKDLTVSTLQKVNDSTAKGRFAATGLTYHTQRMALFDGKRDIIHGMKIALAGLEILFQKKEA
jgi:hypothetical protein